jgi:hypothetical protein
MTSIAQETLRAATSAVEQTRVGALAAQLHTQGKARMAALRRGAQRLWEELADSAGSWTLALASAALVLGDSNSWTQALLSGSCVYAVATLCSLRSTQRREALALQRDLEELRRSLRVTQALLEVEVLDGAEPLEEDVEASGARRVQRSARLG